MKILEAKSALKRDPDWLKRNSILGLAFGDGLVPTLPPTPPKERTPFEISEALRYPLHERLGFVDAPDAVCADLLTDLGNLACHLLTIEHAVAIYDVALRYGPAKPEPVRARRDHLQALSVERMARRQVRHRLKIGIPLGVAAAALLAAAGLAWRRRRRPAV